MVFAHVASPVSHCRIAPRHKCPRHWKRCGPARCVPDGQGSGDETRDIPDFMPMVDSETDWRKFRAELIAASSRKATEAGAESPGKDLKDVIMEFEEGGEWAHHIKAVEPGCLLVAHPLLFSEKQTHFYHSVVLIFMDDDERGTAGLILNNPTMYKIGSVAGAEALCPVFKDNILYLGGDVGINTLHLLHPHGSIQGSREVVRGVYIGGLEDSARYVLEGHAKPDDFQWFGRYCGWAPGQLKNEIASGVWFTAAASSKVVLGHKSTDRGPVDMWHRVLQMMGGLYAELSTVVQEMQNRKGSDEVSSE